MSAIEQRARELLADALRRRNESRLAHMAEIAQGLDQVATYIALDAIIAALTPPEGFVLVPVEPAMDMQVAALNAPWDCMNPRQVWKAMLAARPEVP